MKNLDYFLAYNFRDMGKVMPVIFGKGGFYCTFITDLLNNNTLPHNNQQLIHGYIILIGSYKNVLLF